jgi:hypothetical protein
MIHSRLRPRRVHFNFLKHTAHPAAGMTTEHNGSAEHNGFGFFIILTLALIAIIGATLMHSH